MQSTDEAVKRFFSPVDARPAFSSDTFPSDCPQPASSSSSSQLVNAKQRRMFAKKKLLEDFDNGCEQRTVWVLSKPKGSARREVIPMDLNRDTLLFRSRMNHSKQSLAKVDEEEGVGTSRNTDTWNFRQQGEDLDYRNPVYTGGMRQAFGKSKQWGLKVYSFNETLTETETFEDERSTETSQTTSADQSKTDVTSIPLVTIDLYPTESDTNTADVDDPSTSRDSSTTATDASRGPEISP